MAWENWRTWTPKDTNLDQVMLTTWELGRTWTPLDTNLDQVTLNTIWTPWLTPWLGKIERLGHHGLRKLEESNTIGHPNFDQVMLTPWEDTNGHHGLRKLDTIGHQLGSGYADTIWKPLDTMCTVCKWNPTSANDDKNKVNIMLEKTKSNTRNNTNSPEA